MNVAAFLPPRLLTHVKHVFADEPELLIASSWQELESFIRRKPVSAVILDPSADGIMNVSAVAGLLKRYPSLPLIAYVTLNAPAFNAVAQLGRKGLEDVVLHHFYDAPARFRERVEQVQGNALTYTVLEALADRLRQLPRQLSVTIENLFDQPHRYSSALDLAMEAGIAIVSVYRNLDAVSWARQSDYWSRQKCCGDSGICGIPVIPYSTCRASWDTRRPGFSPSTG